MSSSTLTLLFSILAALAMGGVAGWMSQRGRIAKQERDAEALLTENQRLRTEVMAVSNAASAHDATARSERERAERAEAERRQFLEEKDRAETEATKAQTELIAERGRNNQLMQDRAGLANQFESLAAKIFEEKSRTFVEHNQTNIGHLLTPLREKIAEFQTKVEEVHNEGLTGRVELRSQIDNLKSLNERLSQDAANLVTALRGSSKVQGDWGEFILEGILEASGLRKGHEYLLQESLKQEDGKGARLDVLVNLPGGRHLIIDSKVSLGDYSDYCNNEEGVLRDAALNRHLGSLRTHLKGLSERNYQALYDLNSLDFVVMFVPIEPAFMLAIARDSRLWNDAWEKNILLVSPSTLLFVIRTVAQLWRQEQQTQNVKDIARRGADLYDKFVGFVEDLKGVGNRLTQAKESYDEAFGKLAAGRGNLVRQAELLKALGVKPKKSLPSDVVALSLESGSGELFDMAGENSDGE